MHLISTNLPEVQIVVPDVFEDERGFFFESWNKRALDESLGQSLTFVQDNHSRSKRGTIRGIHYQIPPHPQGKLVRVCAGAIYDVAVDLRQDSPTFREWFGVELNEQNRNQLWIPPGFGHGFLALTDRAEVLYKTTDYYSAACERSVRWNDPEIGVEWPLEGEAIISAKDRKAPSLFEAELFR